MPTQEELIEENKKLKKEISKLKSLLAKKKNPQKTYTKKQEVEINKFFTENERRRKTGKEKTLTLEEIALACGVTKQHVINIQNEYKKFFQLFDFNLPLKEISEKTKVPIQRIKKLYTIYSEKKTKQQQINF